MLERSEDRQEAWSCLGMAGLGSGRNVSIPGGCAPCLVMTIPPSMASDERLRTAAWLGPPGCWGSDGMQPTFQVRPVHDGALSGGQESAGRTAPVDRASRSAPLLSPGDPELPAPRRCRLAPWDRSPLHRVAPSQLSARVGAAHSSSSRPGLRTLAGRPCGALVGHRPVIVVSARSSQLTWRPPNQADQWLSG